MQSATPPVKRGPGRPRKNPAQPSSDVAGPASAPVKRGRGRPRKNPAQPSALSAVNANAPVKRGRGRPRKHPMATLTGAQSSVSHNNVANEPTEQDTNDRVTPNIDAQSSAQRTVKRGRGRPRKNLATTPAIIPQSSVSNAHGSAANKPAGEENIDQVTPNIEAPVIRKRGPGRPRKYPVKASIGHVQSSIAGAQPAPANAISEENPHFEVASGTPDVGNLGADGIKKTLTPAQAHSTGAANEEGGDVITPVTSAIAKRGRGRPRKHPPKEISEKVNGPNVGDSRGKGGGGLQDMKMDIPLGVHAIKEEQEEAGNANSNRMDIPPVEPESSQKAMTTEKKDDPPVKRGRGRPRKHPVPDGAAEPPAKRKRGRPKKVQPQNATETAVVPGTPVKRGRGRPRKNPAPPSSSEPPVKRKRGRPRKDQAQSAEVAPGVDGAVVKRKRGRPRKNPALLPEAVPGTEGTTVKRGRGRPRKHPAPPSSSEPPVKRKRGRPRKNPAEIATETLGAEGAPVKRGRGRPRKQVTISVLPVPIAPRASTSENGAGVPLVARRTPVLIAPRASEPASAAVIHPFAGFGAQNPDPANVPIPIAARVIEAAPTPGVEVIPVKRGRGRPKKEVTGLRTLAPRGTEAAPTQGVEATSVKRGRGRPKKQVTAAISIAPRVCEATAMAGVEEAHVAVPIAPRAGEPLSACVATLVPDNASSAIPVASRASEACGPAVMNPATGLVAETPDCASAPVPIAFSASEAVSVVPHAADLSERKTDAGSASAPLAHHEANKEQTLVTSSVDALASGMPETLIAPVTLASHANESSNKRIEEQTVAIQTTGKRDAPAVKDILTKSTEPILHASLPTLKQEIPVPTGNEDADENVNEEPVQAQPVLTTENDLLQIENMSTNKDVAVQVNFDQDQQVSPLVIANPGAQRNERISISQNAPSIENGTSNLENVQGGNTYETSLPALQKSENIVEGKSKDAEASEQFFA